MAAGDAILDLSDLINLATGGASGTPEQINFYKSGLRAGAAPTAPVAGRLTSLWQWDGYPGAASTTAPTTAVVTTNATNGAFKQTTPGSGKKKYLLGVCATALVAGSIIIYDRLVHHGGMSGTATTSQTTNLPSSTTPALTRHTDGLGVECWLEIYTLIGSTGTTVTCNYNDETPAASTSPAFTIGGTGFREQNRLLPMPLASGDRGVTAVTDVDLVASTTTVGDLGVTLAFPLLVLPVSLPGVGSLISGFMMGGPWSLGVDSDACIALAWQANGTTIPQVFGSAYFCEK
jgi:hypothetical protein